MAALVALLYVVPTYSGTGQELSSNGEARSFSDTSTVFMANPGARPVLIGLTIAAIAIPCLSLAAAWRPRSTVRIVLLALLLGYSFVTLLAITSIGIFLLPLAVCGWIVWLCTSHSRSSSAEAMSV